MAMKEEFRDNKDLTDDKKKFIEIRKAQMGVAHIMLYKEKNDEMKKNYSISEDGFREPLNPKDENFIFF